MAKPGYLNSLQKVVRDNVSAYGYGILITTVYAILVTVEAQPSVWEFVVGAITAFVTLTITDLAITYGTSADKQTTGTHVMLRTSPLHLVALAGGIGGAYLVALTLNGILSWIFSPFVATTIYLLVEAFQLRLSAEVKESVDQDRERV